MGGVSVGVRGAVKGGQTRTATVAIDGDEVGCLPRR